MASTVIGPRAFQDETPEHIESKLTEYIPRRTRNMTIDAVNWAVDIVAVRQHHLYTYAGCESFDEYRDKYLKVSDDWIDKVIAGAAIIERDELSDRSIRNALEVQAQSDLQDAAQEAGKAFHTAVHELHASGKSQRAIAAELGVARTEVVRALKEDVDTKLYNVQECVHPAPTGNRREAIIRRLVKLGRDDLLAKVESGELSANAAAIEAGFRKPPKPPLHKLPDEEKLQVIYKTLTETRDWAGGLVAQLTYNELVILIEAAKRAAANKEDK